MSLESQEAGLRTDERGSGAEQPEDLARLFVQRANAGDVDGMVALYEPDAVLAFPPGTVSVGAEAIRAAYRRLIEGRPTLAPGEPRPTLRNGDLAMTSTRLASGGVTVEVARRQPDGSWRWILDHPNVLL